MTKKFNFDPDPSFLQNLKSGDSVYFRRGASWMRSPSTVDLEIVQVKRITAKFVILDDPKLDAEVKFRKSDGEEYGSKHKYPCRVYPFDQEPSQRDRLISKIKQATQSWDFGKELATGNLEAIAELMEMQNESIS